MITFAQSSDARYVRQLSYRVLGVLYAAFLVLCATIQLFFFEDFVDIFAGSHFSMVASTIAVSVITLEIFSLPFLLRLRMSVLFRKLSTLFSVSVPIVWLVLGFIVENMSIFIKIYPGRIIESLAMGGLAILAGFVVFGYTRK